MASTITIFGRSAGSRRPLFTDWSVPLPPDDFGDEGLTLRTLISRIVQSEVSNYIQRQEVCRLDRVFTKARIEADLARGKVSPEGKQAGEAPNLEEAIGAALQAYEDGLYLVFIDDQEQRGLDHQVYLKPNSRVTFIRLVFLAGG